MERKSFTRRISDTVRNATASALRSAAEFVDAPKATYEIAGSSVDLRVDVGGDTMWATQDQMAALFEMSKQNVSLHLQNLFTDNELREEAVVKESLITAADGKRYRTKLYNLEAIIAVGQRAKSGRAVEFRKWANSVLRDYITKGYALNETRLRNDPDALQELAEKVRSLRVEEKNLYERVRYCFKITASDYDKDSEEARRFYIALQEKFTYAASEHTSAELILKRADGSKDRMGMESYLGDRINLAEAKKGKNYLREDELRYLQLVADAFLIFVESKAMRGKRLTMAELLAKMDKILEFNEMPVFRGYQDGYLRGKADAHARTELDLFKARRVTAGLIASGDPEARMPRP